MSRTMSIRHARRSFGLGGHTARAAGLDLVRHLIDRPLTNLFEGKQSGSGQARNQRLSYRRLKWWGEGHGGR